MNQFEKLFGKFFKGICVIILTLMVLIVFVNTVLRYCFNSGLVENEEVLRYLFVWASFLGIMAVYYEHRHIAVTILTDWLSPRVRNIVEFFANFLVLYAFYLLIDGGIMYMNESWTTLGEMTKLPFPYIIVSSVVCGFVCIGVVLVDMYHQLRAWRTGRGE